MATPLIGTMFGTGAAARSLRFAAVLVAGVLAVGGAQVSAAQARGLPASPTVRIGVSHGKLTMPQSLRSSRYHFLVDGRAGVQLLKVKRGYTVAQFLHDDASDNESDWQRMDANVRFFGGVTPDAGIRGEFWETLYAGTYWGLPLVVEGKFTASDVSVMSVYGSVRPTAWPGSSGTVISHGETISAPAHLPRSGRLVVRNASSWGPDLLVVFKLKPGKTLADLLSATQTDDPIESVAVPVAILSTDARMLWGYSLAPGTYVLATMQSMLMGSTVEAAKQVTVG